MTQITALALSLAVEVPVALLLARRWAPWGRVAVVAIAATLLTHPFAWLANGWIPLPFPPRAAIIEVSVAVVEAVIYARFVPLGAWRGALVSAVANAASFGLGLILAML